jgi:SAM-dependent methyltransferase
VTKFVREDGLKMRAVPGFRDRVLASRLTTTPRPHWTPEEYARSAKKKLERTRRLVAEVARWVERLDRAALLDLGCGDGINCLVMADRSVARAVGIDLRLPLFEDNEVGAQARQLADLVLERLGGVTPLADALDQLPVRFVRADGTRMPFADASFDVLVSRSAMEHIAPVQRALAEMARVVRPGGLIYHRIDPYFWLRGCHKRGLVDIPWAHARLSLEEFRRFVTATEGEGVAGKRCARLLTLNRMTLAQWRAVVEAAPVEVLDWREEPSAFARALLEEYPEVRESLAPGVEPRDLVHEHLEMWLRVKKP